MGKDKNENNEYMVIDIKQIFEALLKRFWVILIAMVLAAVIGFCYASFFIPKMYSSSVMLYVNNSSVSLGNTSLSISASDISASNSLTRTYSVLLKNRTTIQKIIDASGLDYTYGQVVGMLSSGPIDNTPVLKITVTCTDPDDAQVLAHTIALVFPKIIGEIIDGSSTRVVDDAVVNYNKVSPSVSKYTVVGMLFGFLLSVAVIVVITILDDTIKSEDYMIDTYGYPVLAVIPNLDADEEAKNKKYSYYRYAGKNDNNKEGDD